MRLLLGFSLVLALPLAACGGGSNDGDVSTAGDYVEESDDADVATAGEYVEDTTAAVAGAPQTYYCEEGTAFTVTFDNAADPQTASIEIAGETTVLEQVVSASGARYSNGDMVAWFKGATEASFAASGGDEAELITCARH